MLNINQLYNTGTTGKGYLYSVNPKWFTTNLKWFATNPKWFTTNPKWFATNLKWFVINPIKFAANLIKFVTNLVKVRATQIKDETIPFCFAATSTLFKSAHYAVATFLYQRTLKRIVGVLQTINLKTKHFVGVKMQHEYKYNVI